MKTRQNKLTKAQEKRFKEMFDKYCWEVDDPWTVENLKQHLADEIARVREKHETTIHTIGYMDGKEAGRQETIEEIRTIVNDWIEVDEDGNEYFSPTDLSNFIKDLDKLKNK